MIMFGGYIQIVSGLFHYGQIFTKLQTSKKALVRWPLMSFTRWWPHQLRLCLHRWIPTRRNLTPTNSEVPRGQPCPGFRWNQCLKETCKMDVWGVQFPMFNSYIFLCLIVWHVKLIETDTSASAPVLACSSTENSRRPSRYGWWPASRGTRSSSQKQAPRGRRGRTWLIPFGYLT